MNLNGFTTMLADAAPAAAPGTQPQGGPPGLIMLVPYALMIVIMIMIFIGPQRKKAKEQAAMLNSMKPGDKIVTGSGIVGTVVSVKEKTAAIRSADTKMEILKTAIVEITERAGASSGSES